MGLQSGFLVNLDLIHGQGIVAKGLGMTDPNSNHNPNFDPNPSPDPKPEHAASSPLEMGAVHDLQQHGTLIAED